MLRRDLPQASRGVFQGLSRWNRYPGRDFDAPRQSGIAQFQPVQVLAPWQVCSESSDVVES